MNLKTFLLNISTKIKGFYNDIFKKFSSSSIGVRLSSLDIKIKVSIFAVFFLFCAIVIFFFIFPRNKIYIQETYIPPDGALYVDYAPDTLLKGQELKVTLPADLTSDPKNLLISVEPHIKFTSRNEGGVYYLTLDKNLPDDSEIAVVVHANNNVYVDYVIVEEMPQVLQMYPPEGATLDSTNSFSIVFNKPVVPLESVGRQTTVDPSLQISPSIAGTWQWMGTDTLQFVPKTHFDTSTLYTITTGKDSLDFDGHQVIIKPQFHQRTFLVKPLELTTNIQPVSASKPLVIEYSLPIDASKTIPEISVINTRSGERVPATISVKENKISVLPEINKEGIPGFDFGENYNVMVNKVFPKIGNISIDVPQTFQVNINQLFTDSYGTYHDQTIPKETDNVAVVHPSGELHLNTGEEIDIQSLVVDRKIISSIQYGKKCIENCYYGSTDQKNTVDYKQIVLTFSPADVPLQDSFNITFDNIKSRSGYFITRKPYSIKVNKIKKLALFDPISVDNQIASGQMQKRPPFGVGSITICSNYPIEKPLKPKESWQNFIQLSGGDSRLFRWNDSVKDSEYAYDCPPNTYFTAVDVGLDANTEYDMNVSVTDIYDQKVNSKFHFNSGAFAKNDKSISAMQPSTVITQPGDTQLAYAVRNIPTLSVSVCELAPDQYILSRLNGLEWKPNCKQEYKKTIPGSLQNWQTHLVGIPVSKITGKELGLYKVVVGDNDDTVTSWIQISQLAVIEKKSNNKSTYFVFDSKTLQTIPKADVETGTTTGKNNVYSLSPFSQLGKTDELGKITKASVVHDVSVVSTGNDTTVLMNNSDTMQYGNWEPPSLKTYIYSDRPIYKPGDTIEWKSISRDSKNNTLTIPEVKSITLTLKSDDDVTLETTEAALDAYGTASGSFKLPSSARLGGYSISTESGSAYFQTERYVKSPFKVTLTSSSDFYTAGEFAKLTLTAERFEGLPLAGAHAEINTISQNNIYECEQSDESGCSYGDKFESRKTYTIPTNGILPISVPLSKIFSDDDYALNDRIIDTVARVTDNNGRSVSSTKSYSVARSTNNLKIGQSQYYGSTSKPVTTTFTLQKRDQGTAVAGAPIEIFIDRITWEYVERQEQDGNFYKKWTKKITSVDHKTLTTEADGKAILTWQPLKNGEYRIRARHGNGARSEEYFYVEGAGGDDIISEPNNNNNLSIKVPTGTVKVGDTIPVIINTMPTKGIALIALEQADVINHSVIRFDSNSFVYDLKIEKQYVPNVNVSVTILDEKGNISQTSADLSVETKQKELSITIKNNKEQYLPGEKASVSVSVRDQTGAPVPNADVSIAVVDQSILALYGNAEKNLVEFFYSYYPDLVSTISNMVTRLHTIDIALGNGAKGGDGGADDLSRKKRGVFKDTAFWTDHVYTDKNGIATTEFTFPDNLTYWQTEAVVNTKDNLFGTARSVIQTAKLISTEPVLPRFLSYGDTFSIPVQVFNRTKSDAEVRLTVTSKQLLGDKPYTITVPVRADSTTTQYVPMKAGEDPSITSADVDFNVAYKDMYDDVSYTIPMHSSNIFEYVATGAYSPNGSSVQRITSQSVNRGDGVISVRAGATAGEYISKGLLALVSYPFGCVEQKSSKAVTLSEIIKLNADYHIWGDSYRDNVYDGRDNVSTKDALASTVDDIQSQIRESGGYGYYQDMPDNYELTVAVGESLLDIKGNSTVNISEAILGKIGAYVYGYMHDVMPTIKSLTSEEKIETVTRGVALLDRIGFDKDKIKDLVATILPLMQDKKELQKVSGNTLVSALLLGDQNLIDSETTSMIENEINSRMSINSRGAYISSRSDYYHYDSDLSATALYLSHIIAKKDYDNPITYKMLNWITENQKDSGLLGSTRDSIRVVRALISFLEATQNRNQQSTISIYLGSQLLESKKITKNNLFEPLVKNISDAQLDNKKINTIRTTREGFFGSGAPLFSDITYKYSIPAKSAVSIDRGFIVTRQYGDKIPDEKDVVTVKQGEIIKVSLKISTNKNVSLVGIDDAVPAGFEIINENLETEKGGRQVLDIENKAGANSQKIGDKNYYTLYPSHTETLEDRRFVFIDSLTPGNYIYEYYIRARTVGTFTGYPAVVSELYSPEVFGRSAGITMTIQR